MIVASVVTNLDNAMVEDDEDKENKDEEDFIPVSDTLAEEFDETEKAEIKRDMKQSVAGLTYMTNHPAFIKLRQTPLFKCSNGRKTTERVEDKLLLLHAFEKNLKEYAQLRKELDEILDEVRVLNDPATTNEDALRILACSKQATNVTTTNTLGVLGGAIRASNIRQSNMNLRTSLTARMTSRIRPGQNNNAQNPDPPAAVERT